MSPKRKTKQPPANISISGGVKGVGNVVGNESQSNVSISSPVEKTISKRNSSTQLVWVKVAAFLVALAGVLATVGLFVRLLQGFDAILVAELVLAALIVALGISGFLKPSMLVDLFGRLFGKN